MLALIDNYDSFTYNLVQYLGELGADIRVFRNDQISLDELIALKPDQLVISPGPGKPIKDGGVSADAIKIFYGQNPRARRLPRTSMPRRNLWRQSGACSAPHARQDFPCHSQRKRNLPGYPVAV